MIISLFKVKFLTLVRKTMVSVSQLELRTCLISFNDKLEMWNDKDHLNRCINTVQNAELWQGILPDGSARSGPKMNG